MKIQQMNPHNNVLIFDLGGVFIHLSGVPKMMEWTNNHFTENMLWQKWISSETVYQFETGQMKPSSFAENLVSEFSLETDPETFLTEFSGWSTTLFPGSRKLLSHLKNQYTLVCLSNTNEIHWEVICKIPGFIDLFDFTFPSFKAGLMKPDPTFFSMVLDQLNTEVQQVLFFDDTKINIDAALGMGIESYQVRGINQLKASLVQVDLM